MPQGTVTKPGDFAWDIDMALSTPEERAGVRRVLYIHLPGETRWGAIQVARGATPPEDRVWGWDGNEDAPTINPSIDSRGVWHGWLRAGRLVSC